jgi:hypothetical protein
MPRDNDPKRSKNGSFHAVFAGLQQKLTRNGGRSNARVVEQFTKEGDLAVLPRGRVINALGEE